MNWNNLRTLEELTNEYDFLLLDTCVMGNGMKYNKDILTCKEKREKIEDEHFFRNLLMDHLMRGDSCWITPEVCDEYSEISHYPYMKAVRRRGSHSDKGVLNLLRERRYCCREIRRLIEMFSGQGRILGLDKLTEEELELYNTQRKEYDRLQKGYELSDTDYNFLILGKILSQKRGDTALASNDFGILHAWRNLYFNLVRNNKHNKFDFFVRREKGFFKKLT